MIDWQSRKFSELSSNEMYTLLRLRSEVFVVEQNCVFLDMDNKDQQSHHLLGWEKDILVAYSRIMPPGLAYAEASIGRVVNSPHARSRGIGKELMLKAIEEVYRLHGKTTIRIGAQLYLKGFYESIGFQKCSEIYLEDGIQHIEMLLTFPKTRSSTKY